MFIMCKLKQSVVGYIKEEKKSQRNQQISLKPWKIRPLKPPSIFPRRESLTFKSPHEPTFVSQFKYKQNKIHKKIINSYE